MTKTVKVGDSKEVSPFAVREGERGFKGERGNCPERGVLSLP